MKFSSSFSIKDNLVVVLFQTQNSGNLGAVARAMKNMGAHCLRLVDPHCHHLNKECLERAVDARDIIDDTEIFLTLEEAVQDCHQVIATTRKKRQDRIEFLDPDQLIQSIKGFDQTEKIAIVFGREDRGLRNEELKCCDYALCIPTSFELPSLNLSHAVLIVLYEIFKSLNHQSNQVNTQILSQKIDHQLKEGFYQHLEEALISINYLQGKKKDHVLRDLKNIFNRSQLSDKDVSMLRGIFRQILNIRHLD